jgi:hypothetical protein
MTSNINANITINVGAPSTEASLIGLSIYNDHGRTQQVSQEISGSTGVNPSNSQVWVYAEGQSAEDFKEKISELGFFGEPETYGSGSGAWAMVDLNGLKEQGAPVPPLDQMPFVQQQLPGNSHIEFTLSSGTTFSDAVQLQESQGYAAVAAFFSNFSANLNVVGDGQTLDGGLQMLEQIIGGSKVMGIKAFTSALTDANINLTFASWEDLPEDAKERLKKDSLKNLLREEVAGILSGIGDLFEQNFRLVFIVNDAIHVEIRVRGPGLVEWAMSSMDN